MRADRTIEELAVTYRAERPYAVAVWIANLAAVIQAAWAAGSKTLAEQRHPVQVHRKTPAHGH